MILVTVDRYGRTCYAIKGRNIVCITYDHVDQDTDLDSLYNVGGFAWRESVDDIEELKKAIGQ